MKTKLFRFIVGFPWLPLSNLLDFYCAMFDGGFTFILSALHRKIEGLGTKERSIEE